MGKGQGGDKEGKAELASGGPLGGRKVGRAAPPVEENWDSDAEEEERAVAGAGL